MAGEEIFKENVKMNSNKVVEKKDLFKEQVDFEKSEKSKSIEEAKEKREKKRISIFLKWGIVIFVLIVLFFLYWWFRLE